jgi:hypothetical protein
VQQAPGLEALDMHEQVYEAAQGALDIRCARGGPAVRAGLQHPTHTSTPVRLASTPSRRLIALG